MFEIKDLTLTLPRNPLPSRQYVQRDDSLLKYVVWHHTAGPQDQTPEQIARYHISHRPEAPTGWSGIAYHFLVYMDGTIYKVRPIGVIPACVGGHNTESICVCYVGDFSILKPTQIAVAAGMWLTAVLLRAYPSLTSVRGHGSMPDQATQCPGKNISIQIETQ